MNNTHKYAIIKANNYGEHYRFSKLIDWVRLEYNIYKQK